MQEGRKEGTEEWRIVVGVKERRSGAATEWTLGELNFVSFSFAFSLFFFRSFVVLATEALARRERAAANQPLAAKQVSSST